jgi:hypothetical protein
MSSATHWITNTNAGFLFVLILGTAVLIGTYFLPAMLAWSGGCYHRNSIIILNILLGWTVIGWLITLIWAVIEGEGGSFDEPEPIDRKEPVP